MNEWSENIAQAKKLHQTGDLKNARAAYQQILDSEPENADILCHMGILLFQTGKIEPSIQFFEKSVQIDPMNTQGYFFMGIAYFKKEQFDSAMVSFNTVLQRDPKFLDAQEWQARIFEKAGHIKRAYSLYYDLFKKDQSYHSRFPRWIFDLSVSACLQSAINSDDEKKDAYFKEAIQLFEVLQQLDDIRFKAFGHYHAGLFSKFKGNIEKATAHFSEAKTLVPQFKTAAFYHELLTKYLNHPQRQEERNKTRVVFHIGYPKAGSTWLQNSIFPNLCGTRHLGLGFYNILDVNDTALIHYGYPSTVSSEKFILRKSPYEKQTFIDYLKNRLDFNGAINTISDEALLQVDPGEMTDRLSEISKVLDVDVKILIVIRKQRHIVRSEYGQGIQAKKWPGKRLADLIRWNEFTDHSRSLSLNNYDYARHINLFEQRLGKENVLVIPFETMFGIDAVEKIVRFIGADHTREHLEFLTRIPAINKTSAVRKEQIARLNPDMEAILLQIDEHFAPLNKALDEAKGLGLKDLNYY